MQELMRCLTVLVAGCVIAATSISCGTSAGNSASNPTPQAATPKGLTDVTHRFSVSATAEAPVIAADQQGRIFVAWATETDDDALTLFLARSIDDGVTFESPTAFRKVPIYRFTRKGRNGGERTFSTHVLPRLIATSAGLFLGWVEALDGGPEVKYFVAKSIDGGVTFSEPMPVHSESALRPGFTALSASHHGGILSAWLDGRNKSQQPFASVSNDEGSEFKTEQLVFAGLEGSGVCPCCNLAICDSRHGDTYVAFRNSDQGNRDIWIARSPANSGKFDPPKAVCDNHWPLDGCPHDGPALSLTDDRLHLAWMDAHTGRHCVYYSSANPADLDFAPPQEVSPDSSGEQGHPQITLDSHGTLHAIWDESTSTIAESKEKHAASGHSASDHHHGEAATDGSRAILYARLRPGAKGFESASAIAPAAGTVQSHPSVICTPSGRVFAVWKEASSSSKNVVVARIAE